ncbi:hypothetical protein SNEBB_003843 [Seison nebaliae]|nr:hypothetical protein SNEBB_003843 [Seison nebaliae]
MKHCQFQLLFLKILLILTSLPVRQIVSKPLFPEELLDVRLQNGGPLTKEVTSVRPYNINSKRDETFQSINDERENSQPQHHQRTSIQPNMLNHRKEFVKHPNPSEVQSLSSNLLRNQGDRKEMIHSLDINGMQQRQQHYEETVRKLYPMALDIIKLARRDKRGRTGELIDTLSLLVMEMQVQELLSRIG